MFQWNRGYKQLKLVSYSGGISSAWGGLGSGLIGMSPGRVPLELFHASPTGEIIYLIGNYISYLAWQRPRVPKEELESVAGEKDFWFTLLLAFCLTKRPDLSQPGASVQYGRALLEGVFYFQCLFTFTCRLISSVPRVGSYSSQEPLPFTSHMKSLLATGF